MVLNNPDRWFYPGYLLNKAEAALLQNQNVKT